MFSKFFFSLCCLALLMPGSLTAQVEKGMLLTGAAADISSTYQGTNTIFNFSISPSVGAFVFKGLGLGLRYSFTANSNAFAKRISYNSSIGGFAKYYIGKKPVKGVVFINGAYLVATTTNKGNVTNRNGFQAGAGAGAAYFFNKHVALETTFGWLVQGLEKSLPAHKLGLSMGFQIFIDTKKPAPALEQPQ